MQDGYGLQGCGHVGSDPTQTVVTALVCKAAAAWVQIPHRLWGQLSRLWIAGLQPHGFGSHIVIGCGDGSGLQGCGRVGSEPTCLTGRPKC